MNNSDYGQGYQPQPGMPPQYPPQPGLAYPQPVQPGQMSYAQPYQQQMMMPPQQINLMVSNVNNNMAMAGVGGTVKRHPPTIIRLIWFFCVGLYLGMGWLGLAIFFMCTIVGIPLGVTMMRQVPTIMLL